MVDRRPLILEIETLLHESLDYTMNLLNYQRLTLFKHINVVLDSASTSLILANKYLCEMDRWNDIQKDYGRSNRPYDYKRQFDYYDQAIMNGFFFFIFSSFEYSVRLICKQYNPQLFQTQKKYGISALWKGMTSDLLKRRDKFTFLLSYLLVYYSY